VAELPTYPRAVPRGRADGPRVELLGLEWHPLTDLYYRLLRASWPQLFAVFVGLYLLANTAFAFAYHQLGGVVGANGFADDFFFSVQTMATIGYGAMYPKTKIAHVLVTAEALAGLLGIAMSTGIVFAKFARPLARLLFSDVAVVTVREGVPVFMFRVANERTNHVVEATIKLYLVRNETTREGESVRRWHELPLSRSVSPVFALSWTVFHPIGEHSMLHGETAASLAAQQAEIVATLTGIDATLATAIHARHSFVAQEIRFGERFVDVFETRASRRVIDLRRFHETVKENRG
jgi:inward rectifier potassium channel